MDMVPGTIGVDEKTVDITNIDSIEKYFRENSKDFDTVVNFAAYTNVDGAERERGDENGLVWKLNVDGPKNLGDACDKYQKFLLHISTDFVFLGTNEDPGPYNEKHETPEFSDKIGWYAWTKNRGERQIDTLRYAIVRTAYPFRKKPYDLKKDYVHGILDIFDEGKLFPLFTDQILTPILLEEMVPVLEKIIKNRKAGIFHVVSANTTTPFEFGSYLIEKARGKTNVVEKGSMEEFLKAPGRTPRPRLGGLNSQKTQESLGMKFKTWQEMVDEFVEN